MTVYCGSRESRTFLICLRTLIRNAARDIAEERLGFANALEINATFLGDSSCGTLFLFGLG